MAKPSGDREKEKGHSIRQLTLVRPEDFRAGFNVATFITGLAKDVFPAPASSGALSNGSKPQFEPATAAAASKDSLEKAAVLLTRLGRAEEELAFMSKQVNKEVVALQGSLATSQQRYKKEVRSAEKGLEQVAVLCQELEGKMTRVSHTGTRIGDRLQMADSLRCKALEMSQLLGHLVQFSSLGAADGEFAVGLPGVFWEEKRQDEAALLVRKLMTLTGAAISAQERAKLVGAEDPLLLASGSDPGSLHYTNQRLIAYCAWLEQRVLARFDTALEANDVKVMRQCAITMGHLNREAILPQRYIDTMPLLHKGLQGLAWVDEPITTLDPAQIALRMKPLTQLYTQVLAGITEEAAPIPAIFPNAKPALEALVFTVFRVCMTPALQRLLWGPSEDDRPLTNEAPRPDSKANSTTPSNRPSPAAAATAAAATAKNAGGPGAAGQPPHHLQHFRTPVSQQAHLRLLAQAHTATTDLLDKINTVLSGSVDMSGAAVYLLQPFLTAYPQPELQWLAAEFDEQIEALDAANEPPLPDSPPPPVAELSAAVAIRLVGLNEEAVARAVMLSPAAAVPQFVRLLFAGEGPFGTHVAGCLVTQLAHYVTDGIDTLLQRSVVLNYVTPGVQPPPPILGADGTPIPPPSPQPQPQPILGVAPNADSAAAGLAANGGRPGDGPAPGTAKSAEVFVRTKIGKLLNVAHVSADIMAALQLHYSRQVAPHVVAVPNEQAACSVGLLTLMRATEEGVLMALQRAVDTFTVQAEKVLMLEQKRIEFRPDGPAAALFDRPTPACLRVVAMCDALGSVAQAHLFGANLSNFLTEAGGRFHGVLLNHMRQFTYSASGALRWKNDVSQYLESLRQWGVPAITEKMTSLHALTNVLVVNPATLRALVDGTLRMDHREALKYIRLRVDFAYASVDGRSLAQLFSSDVGQQTRLALNKQ